jgi:hypothetical protein
VALFFDAIVIGDGEDVLPEIIAAHRAPGTRVRAARRSSRRSRPSRASTSPASISSQRPGHSSRAATLRGACAGGSSATSRRCHRRAARGAVRRRRPRPGDRRGAARLLARLPLLPGRDDLPPRPGTFGGLDRPRRARRAGVHRLRGGLSHVAFHGGPLAARGHHAAPDASSAGHGRLGVGAVAARGLVHARPRAAARRGTQERSDVRP